MGSNPVALVAAMAVALCGGSALVLLFLRRPRWAVIGWVLALFFTPVWLGAQAGVFVTALTAITSLAIVSSIGSGIRWSHIDSVMVVLFGMILVSYIAGSVVWGHVQDVLTTWLVPYVWGRLILARVGLEWVSGCIAAAAGVAAVLAIAEFATAENLFFLIPGSSTSVWGTLQIRGGLPRAEGAFGHSIALGGSLAMSTAFVMAARWPVWLRAVTLVVITVAAGMTISRIGIIGLILTVLLAALFLGRHVVARLRGTVVVILSIAVVAGLPLLLQVFGDAGSEAEGSAEYRGDLLSLLDGMAPVGVSASREVLATGEDYFGGFRSIDSALILIGLRFGFVPLILLIAMLLVAIASTLRGRGTPASVALVAQIPAFATVALITQYSSFVWFVAGLAVASYSLGLERDGSLRPSAASAEPAREPMGAR